MDKNFWDGMTRMKKSMRQFFSYPDFPERDVDEPTQNYRRAFADFKETEKHFLISVEIPGVCKENIKVNLTDNGIEIIAEKKDEKKYESEDGYYGYSRRYSGFHRTINLPIEADTENVGAEYEDGVLRMIIPKKKVLVKKKEITVR